MNNLSAIETLIKRAKVEDANDYLCTIILEGEEESILERMAGGFIKGDGDMENVIQHLGITIEGYTDNTIKVTDGKIKAYICGYRFPSRFYESETEVAFDFNNIVPEDIALHEVCPYCISDIVIRNEFKAQKCHECNSPVYPREIREQDNKIDKLLKEKESMIEAFRKINRLLRRIPHYEVNANVNSTLDEASKLAVQFIDKEVLPLE